MNQQTRIGLVVAAVCLVLCLGISLCGLLGAGVAVYLVWDEPYYEDLPDVNGAIAPTFKNQAPYWTYPNERDVNVTKLVGNKFTLKS